MYMHSPLPTEIFGFPNLHHQRNKLQPIELMYHIVDLLTYDEKNIYIA
jgi:hypothetical protein